MSERFDQQAILQWLREAEALGWLRPLDGALAEFLREQVPDAPPLLLLAAALTSHQAGRGHVCLDLDQLWERAEPVLSLPPETAETPEPVRPPGELLAAAGGRDAFERQLACPELVGSGPGSTPLVRDGPRLYLRRYWACERTIAQAVRQRVDAAAQWRAQLDPAAVRRWLDGLFGAPADGGPDWQRVACAVAAGSGFSVITGGPGTGKTTTVLRLLALLQGLHGGALRIRLTAPTGKAAARLNASIAGAVDRLGLEALDGGAELRARIPTEVVTVHRLLGAGGGRRFRHHAGEPLAADVVVVDEASMIDVELMAALLEALPDGARLVLLGDKDQLASVEAGAILGELCARADQGGYRPETAEWLEAVSGQRIPPALIDPDGGGIDQHVVMLRHSHRFGADSGIGRLARAVNAGDQAAVQAWGYGHEGDLARVKLSDAEHDPALIDWAVDGGQTGVGHAAYLQEIQALRPDRDASAAAYADWAAQVLGTHGAFQLLAALRRGPYGVEALNERLAAALRQRGLIHGEGVWYEGRPVIVTRNDYGLGLINGDIGIALRVPRSLVQGPQAQGAEEDRQAVLRVAFRAADGSGRIRWIPPHRLESVETAFALTVHKAQGSEFRHAALLLPDRPSPVLTRELLYTGITRASQWFTLLESQPGVLKTAVRQRTVRGGGLRAMLEDFG
ncbi:exodeoxyribonuclease V subunit alpha [Halorhodospira halophila]|uniref:exodeoxyribonuclease V subunit alpha n=1 Tax=Halorhodospira halophila TaxID=1053 RepID=UPI0019145494|nr:exodeoxyribonuclease V subunit alpha [Halorhodospira halophila]